MARAYIQIATICPQTLRKGLLASFLVGRSVAPQGIHYRLIGPGVRSGEVKFLAKRLSSQNDSIPPSHMTLEGPRALCNRCLPYFLFVSRTVLLKPSSQLSIKYINWTSFYNSKRDYTPVDP